MTPTDQHWKLFQDLRLVFNGICSSGSLLRMVLMAGRGGLVVEVENCAEFGWNHTGQAFIIFVLIIRHGLVGATIHSTA
jgi:hypothetical protein